MACAVSRTLHRARSIERQRQEIPLGKWISPHIGSKPIARVTTADVEDVRDALDKAIREYAKHGIGSGRLS